MQWHSRDRDRDDERGRDERNPGSRNEDRASPDRDGRRELSDRRDQDPERGSGYAAAPHGNDPGPSRSGEWRRERDRFEEPYGRSAWQAEDRNGRSTSGSRRDDDFPRNLDEFRNRAAWQPGVESPDSRRSQYGETDYGGYGPRYGSVYGRSGDSARSSGSRYGSHGDESRHEFEPEYQQWRDEQIRNLDEAYLIYRRERYRRFSDEFETWRRNHEASLKSGTNRGTAVDNPVQESSVNDLVAASRNPLDLTKPPK